MKRDAYTDFLAWKQKKGRKPLIIRGARQVGKTWLMKSFGSAEFSQTVYLNFEVSQRFRNIFSGDFSIERIITALEIEAGKKIDPSTTLIIFDEIQAAPEALTSLKYFFENAPEYFVIAAGSLLGVALHSHVSFPVGKVDFLDIYPLSFSEFLSATGNDGLLNLLQARDWQMVTSFNTKYISLLKSYYYTGGMPEVVLAFISRNDLYEVRDIQKKILLAYEQDFSKHAPVELVPRIRMLWNSIPSQLAKENRKFVYSHIKEGARAKEFELAMAWLLDSGLLHKVTRVRKPAMPLKAYEDITAFKLYLSDVGLLGAMTDLDARIILDGSLVFQEFKGALTEQYVLQQLITHANWVTYYWSADSGRAEVDFLLQITDQIIPLEVKAEENLKSKSLKVFADQFKPPLVVRTSMSDFRQEPWMLNLPLYAIHQIV